VSTGRVDKITLWKYFMLLNPPPPPDLVLPSEEPGGEPEKWDPFGLDYALSKLGVKHDFQRNRDL